MTYVLYLLRFACSIMTFLIVYINQFSLKILALLTTLKLTNSINKLREEEKSALIANLHNVRKKKKEAQRQLKTLFSHVINTKIIVLYF